MGRRRPAGDPAAKAVAALLRGDDPRPPPGRTTRGPVVIGYDPDEFDSRIAAECGPPTEAPRPGGSVRRRVVSCARCTINIGPGYLRDELWYEPGAPPPKRRICGSCADRLTAPAFAVLLVDAEHLTTLAPGVELYAYQERRIAEIEAMLRERAARRCA